MAVERLLPAIALSRSSLHFRKCVHFSGVQFKFVQKDWDFQCCWPMKIIPIFGWFLERTKLFRCTWYGPLVRRTRYALKECTQDQHVLAVHRSIKTSTVTVLSNQTKCISFEPVIIGAFSVIETANSLLCKQKNNYKGSYRCFSNILWCWSGFWLRSVLYVHDKALWKTLQYLRKEAPKAFVRLLKFTEKQIAHFDSSVHRQGTVAVA